MSEAIATALRGLLGPRVAVAWAAVTDDAGLFVQEAAGVAAAVSARRAEFAAGRRAARRAMAALGHVPEPVPIGPDRAPLWPAGLTGSLTHDGGLALVALARVGEVRALGIDLEQDADLPADLVPEILSEAERRAIAPAARRSAFAAKEAAFKALFPLVGEVFGFDVIALAPAPTGFAARVTRALGPVAAGTRFDLRTERIDGRLIAALRLDP